MANFNDDFEFYRDLPQRTRNASEGTVGISAHSSKLNEGYARSAKASIASEEVKPVSRKSSKRLTVSKPLLVLAAVGVVVCTTFAHLGIDHVVDTIQTRQVVAEFREDIGANDALREASWHKVTKGGHIHGYNQHTLADYVSEQENPDMAIFGLYSSISTERTSNMDAIVSRVFDNCSSWSEYLTQRGFVDKDGNPSNEIYQDVMNERVMAEQTMNSVQENHGIKR